MICQKSTASKLIEIVYKRDTRHSLTFFTLGLISYRNFLSRPRTVFPAVDQVKVLMPTGNVEIHYNKMKHVDAPEPVEQALG